METKGIYSLICNRLITAYAIALYVIARIFHWRKPPESISSHNIEHDIQFGFHSEIDNKSPKGKMF